jgi:multicomponent Na+:H+ antiporter subunit D
VDSGQWSWAVVMLVGGLLAGGYVYRVIAPALASASVAVKAPASRRREALALALAVGAVLLGFAPAEFFDLLQIGRPVAIVALQ